MFSRPVRTEYGTLGKKVYNTRVYDEFTGRLTRQTTDRDLAPQRIDDTTYSYDDAGNVTNITTASGQDAGKAVDTQCFANDPLGRLTEAWTAKTDCSAQPSATTVGGPDAYWQTFTYDAVGNRVKQVDHGTGALAGSDATTTYTHNDPKTGLPHAVQSATVTGGPHNGQKSTFGYDKAGNTTKRAIGTREQSMTWDAEGHLATLTEDGRTTGYQYDADGDRLITKDADGTQTLTLPGDNELKVKANGTKEGVRYYTHEGETVAVRTSSGFSFLIPDQQGTAMAAIAMTTLAVTRRKQLPFGGIRSQQAESLPGTRGFVGGTNDPTGLVHLGAREYDPALGRFLSVDPVIDLDDPAQMNAYSYAHNNPVTKSDPSGLRPDGPAGGASYNDERWAADRGMTASWTKKNGKWVWKQTPKKDTASRKKYAAYRANPTTYKVYSSNYYKAKAAAQLKQAQARAKAQAIARAKAAEAERRKKDGIFGSIMGGVSKAWNNTGGKVVSGITDGASAVGQFTKDHWRGIAQAGVIIVGTVAVVVCTAATAGVCAGAGGIIMTAAIGASQGIATYGLSGGSHSTKGYLQAGVIGGGTAGGATAMAKAGMLMSRTGPYHTVSTMVSAAWRNGGRFWKGGEYGRQVHNHMRFGTKWAE
ncbi:RHS repeat-associated core domain-containing protein [Streptomyces violaceus]|uniref:RHS repeat-associated core domain-containing protein n=1 Tax=Streptomyces violaceus TaxID=1936 RepID=A0ABZ1NTI5_STRVL